MKKLCVLGLAAVVCATTASAQTVKYDSERKLWFLTTAHSSYVMGVNELNALQQVYWGKRIDQESDFAAAHTRSALGFEDSEGMSPEEYPAWGGMRYFEPCLKATFADGNRDLVLKYDSYAIQRDGLDVRLKDIRADVYVTLRYRLFAGSDVIRKEAVIENKTAQTVTVESAQSGVWYLPKGEGYRLSYLHGYWAGETRLVEEPIEFGKRVLESRRGNTSGQMNPWFAIDQRGNATEEHGRVWFGALAWSGNWKLTVEETPYAQVRVTGGYNDFDFAYPLKPGDSLSTASFYGGFTEGGFGEASREMHRLERTSILPARSRGEERPVLYNSWEATLFNVDEAGQKALADKAASIGVELFVMDDGWFGERNSDRAGLGDWTVNRKKFPNGLTPLIQYVKAKGMKFGLWVEPEMVNPDSELYRKHPDWVLNFEGRPRTEGRHQLVLNIARDEVKEYVLAALDKLLSENDIDFIKWDMNRHVTEPGWPELPPAEQREVWVKYVRSLYEIIDQLRARHPKLEIESCSGGGGRVDLGILSRVEEVWPSDNTEAFDRLQIQEGFSYAYTPKVMMDWVTDVPNMNGRSTSLEYRFLVAMNGALGVGANLNHWTPDEFALAQRMIAFYKKIRNAVQEGDLYRLASPRTGELTANEFVSGDGRQAVLFAYLRSQQYRQSAPTVYLRGLEEKAQYRVTAVNKKLVGGDKTHSGAYLMNRGLDFNLTGDYDATAVTLERVP
jgi:alpha-galactosidase